MDSFGRYNSQSKVSASSSLMGIPYHGDSIVSDEKCFTPSFGVKEKCTGKIVADKACKHFCHDVLPTSIEEESSIDAVCDERNIQAKGL